MGGIIRISQKDRLIFISYNNKVLLGLASQYAPPPPLFLNPLPFSLAKKRAYLDTHLKEELTYLFSKLPRYSLFPLAEWKENDEHFADG